MSCGRVLAGIRGRAVCRDAAHGGEVGRGGVDGRELGAVVVLVAGVEVVALRGRPQRAALRASQLVQQPVARIVMDACLQNEQYGNI